MKHSKIIILIVFFLFCIFLTLNRHSKYGIYNYHSEIWGDKAGYYIYLPAFFIYNFEANRLPPDIATKTGNGFSVRENKIYTKYSCGVALMQSPFFLASHLMAKTLNYENNGFSLIYHKMIDIAAVFYTFLGFIFLYLFLVRYVDKNTAFYAILCMYLGTNVFYYSIFETGMSHIYSFFLFSCYLYLIPFIVSSSNKIGYYILFGLISGLIVIVRPINVIFLPVFFLFHRPDLADLKKNLGKIVVMLTVAALITVPQILYWKYCCGSYLRYSYEKETFSNVFTPKIAEIWFSTNNSLFIYNPLMALMLIGLVFYYKTSAQKSILIGLYFLFISYMFASWHDWRYGCAYASRPYTEFYTLFTLPFCYTLQKTNRKRIYLGILIILCILYNLKLIFSYDGCVYTNGAWDWSALLEWIQSPIK
jgi:hypothetical protein